MMNFTIAIKSIKKWDNIIISGLYKIILIFLLNFNHAKVNNRITNARRGLRLPESE